MNVVQGSALPGPEQEWTLEVAPKNIRQLKPVVTIGTAKLLVHHKMDVQPNETGVLKDSGPFGLHGVLGEGSKIVSGGKFAGALSLPGTSEAAVARIKIRGELSGLTSPMTVMLWAKPTKIPIDGCSDLADKS